MNKMLKHWCRVLVLAVLIGTGSASVFAAEHEIKMLNRGSGGQNFVFEPALLKIEPGDTVHFIPTTRGHDAQSIEGMVPEGAEPFASGMNKALTVTLTEPGVYGYKCRPHYPVGMVGLIVVGDGSANAEEAKAVRHVGKAKMNFEALFGEAGL